MSVKYALTGLSAACLTPILVPIWLLMAFHFFLFWLILIIIGATVLYCEQYSNNRYQIIFTSYYLSLMFICGALLIICDICGFDELQPRLRYPTLLVLYTMVMAAFHWSEYLLTATNHHVGTRNTTENREYPWQDPPVLSWDSFLLNHSVAYAIADAATCIEFAIQHFFFSGTLLLIIKFSIMLVNPICTVGSALVAWQFFVERVHEEEMLLISFFGEDYVDYKLKVPSGLPFIHGVRIKNKDQ